MSNIDVNVEVDSQTVTVIDVLPTGPRGPQGIAGEDGATSIAELTDVDLTGLDDGETLIWDEGSGMWVPGQASGEGAPDAKYLVTEAHPGLTDEVVVGTTPGGELGGSWASPTVDTVHSGSSHVQIQAAAEATAAAAIAASEAGQVRDGDAAGGVLSGTYPNPGFAVDMATQAELDAEVALARNGDNITSGTVADARIAATIARLDSPAFTGNPTAPTQAPLSNNTRLANTAYVDAAITTLIGTAPGTLDTLGEISDAINDDANLYTTLVAAIAAKVSDASYDQAAWNGVTDIAASKNAVRDLIESIVDGQVFGGEVEAPSVKASGKTGATSNPVILAGGTTSGPPSTGTHVAGEVVVDATGLIWYCTAGGTPGTWVDKYGNVVTAAIATHDADVDAHASAFDAFAQTLLQHDPTFLEDYFWFYDEFLGAGITSGAIGSLGWAFGNTGTGAIALPAADLAGPGVVSLNSPATSDTAHIGLDAFLFTGSPEYHIRFRIRQSTASTALVGRWGMLATAVTAPGDGAWFETGATNYQFKTRHASGTAEVTDTGVAVDTAWHWFDIISDGSSVITAYIDGVLEATHTTRPTTALLTPRIGGTRASGSGNANVRIDAVWGKIAYGR